MKQAQKIIKKVHIKSAVPIFAAAGVFLLFMLILPGYKLWAILLSAVLAAGTYVGLGKTLFKGRDVELVHEEFTGDKELDALIAYGQEIIGRFRAAAEKASDEKVASLINRIADAAEGIVDDVVDDPTDKGDAYTFFSYYLPTLDKLLSYYTRFSEKEKGENSQRSRARIENCLEMVAGAFEKFLDKLYRNDAEEIKTSIEVLKIMLRSDGLAKKEDTVQKSSEPIAYSASDMDAEIESISHRLQNEAEMELKQVAGATH